MTLIESQLYLTRILKCFGFLLFNIQEKYEFISKIYSLIVNCFLTFLLIYQVKAFLTFLSFQNNPMIRIFYFLQCFASVVMLSSMIYHSLFAQSKFKLFFARIESIEKYYLNKDIKKTSQFLFLVIFIETVSSNILLSVTIISKDQHNDTLKVFFIHFGFQFTLFYVNLILIFLIINLKLLSACLKTTKKVKFCQRLNLFKLMDEVKQVVNTFSETFGIIILNCVFYCYWMTALELFFSINLVLNVKDANFTHIAANSSNYLFAIPNSILIFLIGQKCSEIKNSYFEAFHKLPRNNKIVKDFEEMLKIDSDIDLQFNTNGFYAVDSSLFLKVNLGNY